MTNPTRNQKGMTLIEMVVAIGILAILMTVVVRIINSSLKAVEGGHSVMRTQADSSTAMDYMIEKIQQAENICAPASGAVSNSITFVVSPVYYTRQSGPYKEKTRFRTGFESELEVPPATGQGRKIIIEDTCRQSVNGQNESRSMLVAFLSEIDEQKLQEPDQSAMEFSHNAGGNKTRIGISLTMGLLQKPYQTDTISTTPQGPWIKYHTYAGSVTPENLSSEDACAAYRNAWCSGF